MITWDQWLNWACLELKQSINPRIEAEILLGKVINKSRIQLLTFGDTKLEDKTLIILRSLINRRKIGEPIAYLIKLKEFWSLNFTVLPGAFIPRSDTECLVEQVLTLFSRHSNLEVLDLGTGVGSIALALASERPKWNIVGVDCQKQALVLASKNKLAFKLNNVVFKQGNWFKYLKKEKFHLIVSNPPYISQYDWHWVDPDIKFEPKNALISDHFGLADLIMICQNSVDHLYSNGWLFLEHGWNQSVYVRKLLNKLKFHNINTILDYNRCERVTYGQWSSNY